MRINGYRSELVLLVLLFAFLIDGRSQDEGKPYKITDVYKDSTLSKDEAKVEFIFTNHLEEQINIPVRLHCNGKLNTEQKDANGAIQIKLEPQKYSFSFHYRMRQEFQYIADEEHIIITDSILIEASNQYIIQVNLGDVKEKSEGVIVKKPQIYFYPEKQTEISMELAFKGDLSFTYPFYDNGWKFTASPEGVLMIDTKQYNYLFWDGIMVVSPDQIKNNVGFTVNQNELISFMEDKLTTLGLNSREQQDFITFWAPQMANHEQVFIHFLVNEACEVFAEMDISPKPDNILRVYMLWTKVDPKEKLVTTEQELPLLKRAGFTVVEWGGVEFSGFENSLINY